MATTPDSVARALAQRPRPVVAAPAERATVTDAGYGGLVSRAAAAAIDAALIDLAALAVAAVVTLVLSIFPVTHNMQKVLVAAGGVLFVVWTVAYFVTFWTTTGQTPGDRVMRIRVVRVDGTLLRPVKALVRLAGAVVGLFLFLGYIPILLSDHRRAFHDWLAGTVVVNQPDPTRGTHR